MRTNKIREKWEADEPIVNGWLTISNGFSAEVMAHQGFDALTVDLQHGVNDEMNLISMLQAISTTDTVPI
ncbi:MAG: 2,4-dihydroxyhept-2-ene-1,7-dioic acid aldolase, partial [Oceanospirillales bacterium TMED59]